MRAALSLQHVARCLALKHPRRVRVQSQRPHPSRGNLERGYRALLRSAKLRALILSFS